jgi:hypothetical protein
LLRIESITKQRDLNLIALESPILNLESGTKQGIDENEKITKAARKILTEKNEDIFDKMKKSQDVITNAKKDFAFDLQVVINTDISIKKLEIEIKYKNCP